MGGMFWKPVPVASDFCHLVQASGSAKDAQSCCRDCLLSFVRRSKKQHSKSSPGSNVRLLDSPASFRAITASRLEKSFSLSFPHSVKEGKSGVADAIRI